MRVLFCKINCPTFICFCKPSPSIYTPRPLRLENSTHAPSPASAVSLPSDAAGEKDQASSDSIPVKEESACVNGKQSHAQNCLKSSLKRTGHVDSKEVEKKNKKVQWVDVLGKQLVEIKEFESSDRDDADSGYQGIRPCVCVIL